MPHCHYQVSIPQPSNHLLHICLTIDHWSEPTLDWKMPVWSVGSYLIREYSRLVVSFESNCAYSKIAKNHWRLQTADGKTITIRYQVFCHELTVRTNHVDETHAFWNGSATFGWIDGYLDHPYTVTVLAPDRWRIATALTQVSENTYLADSFHTLADSPFEVGIHQVYQFQVLGKPHELVIWGEGNIDPVQTIEDIKKIIVTEANFWGQLPYSRYLFILHLSTGGYGGLEHRDCCVLLFDRWSFRQDRDKYGKFLNLVSHEFFHLWNVKRLRPQSLFTIDYEAENYTHSLWFCEGVTSYYDQLLTLRAGLVDRYHYLQQVSDSITKLQTTPGRKYQSLWESSFDTWIKLYRPDVNSANTQISYYLKGELVAMLLDLHLRLYSPISLDTVLQTLWQRYGSQEFPYDDRGLLNLIGELSGLDLTQFWQDYLYGTTELNYDYYFAGFGLKLQAQIQNPTPYTGITFGATHGNLIVKTVHSHSPAQLAGIDPGDEIIALNQRRITLENVCHRLQAHRSGDTVQFTIFAQDELRTVSVILAEPVVDRYLVNFQADLSECQLQNLSAWLNA